MSEPHTPVTRIFIPIVKSLSKYSVCPWPHIPEIEDKHFVPWPAAQVFDIIFRHGGELAMSSHEDDGIAASQHRWIVVLFDQRIINAGVSALSVEQIHQRRREIVSRVVSVGLEC